MTASNGSETRGESVMKTDAERIKWLLDRSPTISNIIDGIEDEGDRAYFGSTNDADELRAIGEELEAFWYSQQDDCDD